MLSFHHEALGGGELALDMAFDKTGLRSTLRLQLQVHSMCLRGLITLFALANSTKDNYLQ